MNRANSFLKRYYLLASAVVLPAIVAFWMAQRATAFQATDGYHCFYHVELMEFQDREGWHFGKCDGWVPGNHDEGAKTMDGFCTACDTDPSHVGHSGCAEIAVLHFANCTVNGIDGEADELHHACLANGEVPCGHYFAYDSNSPINGNDASW